MTASALPASEVAGTDQESGRVTYADFLAWPGDNPHLEWVKGKLISMKPVSLEHSDTGLFLLKAISAFVETEDLGKVLSEPFQMKTGPDLPGRAPDILFVAKANLGRLQPLFLDGPGDLVVEVISPGSRAVDRGEKFYEYEQGGVPEYWLIDPPRRQAEFYQRGEDGIYRPATLDAQGRYSSRALPGLWLQVDWLWQHPLPPLLRVLKEWRLI